MTASPGVEGRTDPAEGAEALEVSGDGGPATHQRAWVGAALIWAVVMAAQLLLVYVPEPAGIADNGDSTRTLCSIRFYMAQPPADFERLNDWVIADAYEVDDKTCTYDLPTSWWHRIFGVVDTLTGASETTPLKIGNVALVNMVLVATAMAAVGTVIAATRSARFWLVAGLALIVLDVAFLGYARSWYTEPAGFVSMLAAVAAVMALARPTTKVSWAAVALTVLATVGLTLAKVQGVMLALPVVVVSLAALLPFVKRVAGLVAIGAIVVAYIGSAVVVWSDQPEWMQNVNRYHSVLAGVAVHADYSTQALKDLGMNPGLARYTGKGWWDPKAGREDPAFWEDYDQTSLANVGRYYVTHPKVGARAVGAGISASFEMRPDYLGSYDIGSAHEPREQACRWCGFSSLASDLRPVSAVVIGAMHVLAAAGLVRALRTKREPKSVPVFQLAVVGVVSIAWYDLAVIPAVVGDGTYELVKHTIFGSYAMGICLWALVGQMMLRRRLKRRAAFDLGQPTA
jgi:hypothetical protein